MSSPNQDVDVDAVRWPSISEDHWWRFGWRSPERVKARLKIVPLASKSLAESDLLLVDAPVCMEDSTEGSAYLCDAPPFARRDDDARVPLLLAGAVRQRLAASAMAGTDWIPFCRILGIFRNQPRGLSIEVLQLSVRTPRPIEVGWPRRLIEEAKTMQGEKAYRSDDDIFVKSWIPVYRALAEKTRAECDGSPSPSEHELAAYIFRQGSYFVTHDLVRENNPYLHAEGFWSAVAGILPAWRDHFPLTRPQTDALLDIFDATYDEAWKSSMRDLALSGLFRFTPDVMMRIRARVAGLSSKAPVRAALEGC